MNSAGLVEVLSDARNQGLLGPGPVERHIAHADAWAAHLPVPDLFVDLGSGGGIPGLVFLGRWPRGILVESRPRRAAWLEEAASRLGWGDRVRVECARAEELGRGTLREAADLVVARLFGAPAPTAECAAALVRVGGLVSVSEPPTGERWPEGPLQELGLGSPIWIDDPRVVIIHKEISTPDRYPRRPGIPAKRPLW